MSACATGFRGTSDRISCFLQTICTSPAGPTPRTARAPQHTCSASTFLLSAAAHSLCLWHQSSLALWHQARRRGFLLPCPLSQAMAASPLLRCPRTPPPHRLRIAEQSLREKHRLDCAGLRGPALRRASQHVATRGRPTAHMRLRGSSLGASASSSSTLREHASATTLA